MSDGSDRRHFFKVISTQSAQSKCLVIPTAFMRQYGDTLPNKVFLEVPSGVVWPAELRKSSGAIWLQNGWQEFRDFYNIGFGHFLVFRYDGKSHFHVLIFDRSTLEIEYLSRASHRVRTNFTGKPQVKVEYVEVDDSVEIQEEFSTHHTRNVSVEILDDDDPPTREKSQPPSVRSTRKRYPQPTDKSETTSNHKAFDHSRLRTGTKRLSRDPGKVRAMQSAKAFTSESPFFMVIIQRSHIATTLYLPWSFVNEHFVTKDGVVTLQVPNGRTWSIKFTSYPVRVKGANDRVRLRRGWSSFVRENYLAVGDVCVFELIKGVANSLKVVIFRAAKDADCCPLPAKQEGTMSDDYVENHEDFLACPTKEKSPASCSEPCKKAKIKPTYKRKRCHSKFPSEKKQLASDSGNVRALHSAKAFNSKNPFFMVAMRASYVAGCVLTVPLAFASQYFTKKHNDVTLQVSDGRTWCCFYTLYPMYGRISGWATFARDNSVAVGDVCVFELIKSTRLLLNVVIFRAAEYADCTLLSEEEASDNSSE